VFDSARTLLIAEIDGQRLVGAIRLTFDPQRPLELLQLLRAQQVGLIICGAVSEGPAAMLESAGVRLIPFITGEVDRVLAHYLLGRPFGMEFCMPGCGRGRCCRKGMAGSAKLPAACALPGRTAPRRQGNAACTAGQVSADHEVDAPVSPATTDGDPPCRE